MARHHGPQSESSPGTRRTIRPGDARGRWYSTGDTVKFDTAGRLVDGQHRLQAIISAGIPQTLIVVWGVQPPAIVEIDTNTPRFPSDVLKIYDPTLTNVTDVAAATAIIVRWVNGERGTTLRSAPVSRTQLRDFYATHKEDIIAAALGGKRVSRHTKGAPRQAFSLCHWLFAELDATDAEFFWDRLVDGVGLESSDPIYVLRELLRREAAAFKSHPGLTVDVATALMIKAWNAYRRGDTIRMLKYTRGGANPERYPEAA